MYFEQNLKLCFRFQFHPQLCDLEAFRQRHLQLCKLSEKLDHMHSAFVLVTFVIDIPSIVILISVSTQDYSKYVWCEVYSVPPPARADTFPIL